MPLQIWYASSLLVVSSHVILCVWKYQLTLKIVNHRQVGLSGLMSVGEALPIMSCAAEF